MKLKTRAPFRINLSEPKNWLMSLHFFPGGDFLKLSTFAGKSCIQFSVPFLALLLPGLDALLPRLRQGSYFTFCANVEKYETQVGDFQRSQNRNWPWLAWQKVRSGNLSFHFQHFHSLSFWQHKIVGTVVWKYAVRADMNFAAFTFSLLTSAKGKVMKLFPIYNQAKLYPGICN